LIESNRSRDIFLLSIRDAGAQRNLGIMYVEGEGIPQDITQGVYWLSKAAEQGLAGAQLKLGVLYEKGEGIRDYVKGYAWFNIAALQEDKTAKKKKNLIVKKMSPGQIEKGEKLSKELYDKIHGQAE
jgi:TPR repeat protein